MLWLCFALSLAVGVWPKECLVGIGVMSTSNHFEQRNTVRGTWFQYPSVQNKKACVVFVIGEPSSSSVKSKLEEEMKQFGDITMTGSPEGWERLTYQALQMHKYFHGKADWVVKTDDDTMIRVDRLVSYLENDPSIRKFQESEALTYVGWKVNGAPVHRHGRYMLTPQEFAPEVLPEYMSGPSYMASGSLTDRIVSEDRAGKLLMLKLEDIALAIWVDMIRKSGTPVETIDNRSFFKVRTCHDQAFSVLLEEGRPLMLDKAGVAKAMKTIFDNDLAGVAKACPYETTMEWLQERSRREKEEEEKQKNRQSSNASPPTQTTRAPSQERKHDQVSVVLYDDPRGYHPFLSPGSPTCPGLSRCHFALSSDLPIVRAADAVIFLGDTEYYQHQGNRVLPERTNDAPWMFVFREALHKFPSVALNKYNYSITYKRDDFITYSYVDDVDEIVRSARESMKIKQAARSDHTLAPVAFVSLRCGGPSPNDPRFQRTAFVEQLGKTAPVDSYGVCLNNKTWPEGHPRDKHFVMQQHRFCIAMENSFDPDYVTEKMFDCLKAGAIPIYSGPTTARDFAPGGAKSVIFVSDFASTAELGEHILRINSDETLYKSYVQWIYDPPSDWLTAMRKIQAKDIGCHVCSKLAGVLKKKNSK